MKVLCMHTAGLGELVAGALRLDLGATITYTDDSAVVFTPSGRRPHLDQIDYVRNCFVVLGSVPRRGPLHRSVEAIARQLSGWSLRRTGRPYRLMFSEDGQLAGIAAGARAELTRAIGRATGGQVLARGGGDEFWVITRRDLREVMLCQRVQRPKRRETAPGVLAPDLCRLIVSAARSEMSDTILDPFAGSGALIAARIRRPFHRAICNDLGYDTDAVRLLPGLGRQPQVDRLSEDARQLPSVADASVDLVVTDPPWGEHEQQEGSPPGEVVVDSLPSIRRVLRPDGQLLMLLARRLAPVVQHGWRDRGLRYEQSHDLLVNGHPATVLLGRKDR